MKSSFLPAFSFGFLIFVMASLPGSDLGKVQSSPDSIILLFLFSDQWMHFFTFGVLTFLIYLGFNSNMYYARKKLINTNRPCKPQTPYLKIILIPAGYGVLIELYQAVLPYRSFGLDDIAWNSAGIITVSLSMLLI